MARAPGSAYKATRLGKSVQAIFDAQRALIGVVHVDALPGTPASRRGVDEICELAVRDARRYREAGFSGLIIENMHDRPYIKGAVGPEVVAAMAVIGREVRAVAPMPLGVQVLAAANKESIAVAMACGASFVRVEGFVFAHVADEGVIESSAGELLRYRRAVGADDVFVLADVKKKHSAHAITADVDLVETARAAEFFLADGVIVTGVSTGVAADAREVSAVAEALPNMPVLVGSGITAANIASFAAADGYIVGSSVKENGVWSNPVDLHRAEALARAFVALPPR